MTPNRLRYSDVINICVNCGSYVYGICSFSYVEHTRIRKIAQVFQVKQDQIHVKFVTRSWQNERKRNKTKRNETKRNASTPQLRLSPKYLSEAS
jgi:hypothetical protein